MMSFDQVLRYPDSDFCAGGGGGLSVGRGQSFVAPRQSEREIQTATVRHLLDLVSVDSQSDEACAETPSSKGQRVLAEMMSEFMASRGLETRRDERGVVCGLLRSNIPGAAQPPAVAFIVHLDTAKGTKATDTLAEVVKWDGRNLNFAANPNLVVGPERFPSLLKLRGQTLIHGDGSMPFGLDNKAGGAELRTLIDLLTSNPEIPHGDIHFCFRPDEEIARHAAVELLAKDLARRGVKLGWTVDGMLPFEVNVSNFNAARAAITFEQTEVSLPPGMKQRELTFAISGVDTHGATAKEEGYLNAIIVMQRAYQKLADDDSVEFIEFDRTEGKETSGRLKVLVLAHSEEDLVSEVQRVIGVLEAEVAPHRSRGADLKLVSDVRLQDPRKNFLDGAIKVAEHVTAVLEGAQVLPVLSEQSEGTQGYSNPHWVGLVEGQLTLHYRLRDFDPALLARRGEDLKRICEEQGSGRVVVTQQYVDMGPELRKVPELLDLPVAAFEPLRDRTSFCVTDIPVRGGTGVDVFTSQGVAIGNLGVGYWFIESPKEVTTHELLGLHSEWLCYLVQAVAARR